MSTEVIARLRKQGRVVKTRKQWGSRLPHVYAERLRSKPVDFPVDYGFLHITVTRLDGTGPQEMRDVEDIGMERFGSGVSYNWVIDHRNHVIYQGMPLGAKGTHTVNEKGVRGFPDNLNYFGHAVAWLGLPGDPFCDECEELVGAIFAAEKAEGIMRPEAVVYPHSDFAAKECPTEVARKALPRINVLSNSYTQDWFGMASIDDVQKALLDAPVTLSGAGDKTYTRPLHKVLRQLEDEQDTIKQMLREVLDAVKAK